MANEDEILIRLGLDPNSIQAMQTQATDAVAEMKSRLERLNSMLSYNQYQSPRNQFGGVITDYNAMFDAIDRREAESYAKRVQISKQLQKMWDSEMLSKERAIQKVNQALGVSDEQYLKYQQAKVMQPLIEGYKGGGVAGFIQQGPEAARLVKAVNDNLGIMGESLKRNKTFSDNFFGGWNNAFAHILRGFVLWNGIFTVYQTALQAVDKTFGEIVDRSKEFQVQGVLFQAYQKASRSEGVGINVSNGDLLRSAIGLASEYGDEVNDVSQDLALWTKRTGDWNAAQYMTNQTLKFQLATGTQIEDQYRALTALSTQAPKIFGLQDTAQTLQLITAAAVTAGAGMHQLSAGGDELSNHLNNSAVILLEAMEKDAAAMASLGYGAKDIVALNQALIQSFGNVGSGAQDAAEKIGRLAGGIASLSNPSKVAALQKVGIDVTGLNTNKDILDQIAKKWDGLSSAQQKNLAVSLAGWRQYEALEAILGGLAEKARIMTAMQKNMNAEDDLANGMQSTYEVELKKVNAQWEGFLIAVGQGALPVLQAFITFVGNVAIPAIDQLSVKVAIMAQSFASFERMSMDFYSGNYAAGMNDMKGMGDAVTARDTFDRYFQTPHDRRYLLNMLKKYDATKNGKGLINPNNANDLQDLGVEPFQLPSDVDNLIRMMPGGEEGLKNALTIGLTGSNMGPLQDWVTRTNAIREALERASQQGAQGKQGAVTNPAAGKKGKLGLNAPAPDFEQYAKGLEEVVTKSTLYIDSQERIAQHEGAEVSILEKKLKMQPQNLDLYRQITEANNKRNVALQNEATAEQKGVDALQKKLLHAENMVQHSKKGSKEQMGWINTEDQIIKKITEGEGAVRQHRDAVLQNNAAMQAGVDIMAKGWTKNIDEAFSAFDRAKSFGAKDSALDKVQAQIDGVQKSIQKILPLIKDPDVRAFLSGFTKDYTQRLNDDRQNNKDEQAQKVIDINTKIHDSQQKIIEDQMEMSSMHDYEKQYYKDVYAALKNYNAALDEAAKIKKEFGNAQGDALAQQFIDTAGATRDADLALAAYNEHMKALEDTTAIKALKSAFDDLASTLSTDVENQLFGKNAETNQQNLFDDQISGLQSMKSLEDALYNSRQSHSQAQLEQHKLLNYQLDQEVKNIERAKKAEEDRANHPTLLKKFAQDFTKSIMDDLLKQLASNTIMGILHKFLNAPDEKAQIQAVMTTLKNTITASTPGSMKDNTDNLKSIISQGPQSFYQTTQTLKQAMDEFNSAVTRLMTKGSTSGGPGGGGPSGSDVAMASSLFGNGFAANLIGLGTGIGLYGVMANQPSGGGGGGGGAPSGGGSGSNATPKPSALQKGFGAFSAFAAGTAVASQGGMGNAVMGGLSSGLGVLAATGNPYLAAGAGLISFASGLGHHDDPAKMPDKYDPQNFTTMIGELIGNPSHGSSYAPKYNPGTDPVQQSLGGVGMLQYIQNWVKSNLNSADKTKQKLAQQLMGLFGDTGGGQLTFDHDIANVHVVGGSLGGNYYDVYNQASQAIQEIQDLQSAQNTTPIVGFNQVGGGFFPYSWDTPGYDIYNDQNNPATTNMPSGGSGGPSVGGGSAPARPSPSRPGRPGIIGGPKGGSLPIGGGGGGGSTGGVGTNSYSRMLPVGIMPAPIAMNVTIPANLFVNGRLLARTVQGYSIQSNNAGYTYIT